MNVAPSISLVAKTLSIVCFLYLVLQQFHIKFKSAYTSITVTIYMNYIVYILFICWQNRTNAFS